jgi:predicted metal-dependent phosphoesterase TrpH
VKKKIDLHTHSSASDGLLSPSELVDHAVANGVSALALTDHDTVDGLDEALEHAGRLGLEFIPGVEFSVEYPRGSFHLVGLHVDHAHEELLEALRELKKFRDSRAERIILDLKSCGVDIPLDDVLSEAGGAPIGKPHFARVMVRFGFAANVEEVFLNYLVDGKPGDVKKEKIELSRAIGLIRKAGGIPVLAHPVSLEFASFRELEDMIPGMIEMGLEGIEAYACMHTPEQVDAILDIGRRHGLLVTGGSDFHGDGKVEIGSYGDGRKFPAELLDELRTYRMKSAARRI